ncbi:MAG: CotH kinase family protein, partial [Bacteroidota bacterium]
IGRQPDGNASIFYFGKPTPDSTNNFSIACIDYNSAPLISLNAGFYSGPQTITITTTSTGATTCYTLDGSTPEDFSPVYSGPLTIDSTMVVKARSFGMGKLPSKTESNSYFIDFNTDLPVVSISTLPAHFWDWDKGIYVMGPNADTVMPYFNANFWQDWERPIHFEYFNVQGGQEFEQDFGVKIHGGWSRANDLKSLRILAKGKYGEPELNYRLFPGKDITEFKSFVLRNSGNETNVTHFRDALMHKAVQEKTHIDIQDYQPSVVFINGEYMGILNLREKISTDYLAENHGVDPDSVDLLQFDGYVIDGQNDNYLYMAEFIITNDMAIQANYEQAKEMLDIENFCDYFIAETYYINWDWPQNNVKYWRERKPGAKWRYIMTDVDFGLGLFGGAFSSNDLQRVIDQDDNSHSKMFRSLLHNQEFREYFVNRYADLINTIFLPENLSELALSFKDSLYDEMPRHMARWNGDFNAWDTYHIDGTLIGFINNRAYPARNHIQEQFALTKQVSVTLKVYPAEAGTIQINTIQPDEYPWSGVYYDGVPVTITAIPNPGYEFAFWQSPIMIQNPLHNPAFTMNLDTNDIFTAYFFGAPDTNRISISEINYNSSVSYDAGDWVELHNYGTTDIDLSGWIFKDGDDNHSFAIPNGTMLVSNSYLVLCRDTADFSAVFPGISNYTGPFDFGLSSTGEALRLYDPEGNLFISAEYYSISPWPSSPNGGGTTLELIDPYDDPGHYTNWFAGCQGGSPGGPFQPCNTEIENPSEISFDFINYPNPFSEHTTFAFKLDRAQNVEITLIDQQGKTAALVVNRRFSEGKNEVGFDASGLNQGVYYCRFRSEEFIRTRMLGIIR